MIISFGAVLKILNQVSLHSVRNYELCDSICKVFEPQMPYSIDGPKYDKLVACKKDFPEEAAKAARKIDVTVVQERLRGSFIELIDKAMANETVLAIRDILEKTDIPLSAVINTQTKESLIKDKEVVFERFLADILTYVANQKNVIDRETLEFIDNHPVQSYKSDRDSICVLISTAFSGSPMTLKPTLKPDRFNATFSEVPNYEPVSLPNKSHIRMFFLSLRDFEFDYSDLVQYLKGIVCQYVNDRSSISEKLTDLESHNLLVAESFSALRKAGFNEDGLKDLLIYAFLECVLKAPKIMSRHEVLKYHREDSPLCEGIHLLHLPSEPLGQRFQLVYGSACTADSLEDIVGEAIENLSRLRKHLARERMLLNPTSLGVPYSDELKVFFKKLLYGDSQAKTAFGVFLGYSLSIPRDSFESDQEYEAAVKSRMECDIKEMIPKLTEKLKEKDLVRGCPFYVYLLPFNSVMEDSARIVKEMLE